MDESIDRLSQLDITQNTISSRQVFNEILLPKSPLLYTPTLVISTHTIPSPRTLRHPIKSLSPYQPYAHLSLTSGDRYARHGAAARNRKPINTSQALNYRARRASLSRVSLFIVNYRMRGRAHKGATCEMTDGI